MNASLNWIKAYVPELSCTPQEFCDAMTLSGTKVESFEVRDKNLAKIRVGKILSIEKHPDADKLVVCQVEVGEAEPVQIVTGAPNIKKGENEGALVPVVLDGGKVAGGHDGGPLPEDGVKIKKGKLRGVASFGMLCSIEELGGDRNLYPLAPENGIYIFPEELGLKPGDDAIEALGLHDTEYEFEITNNRVDCYSILGIAREAAATFRKPFCFPAIPVTGNAEKASDYIKVSIEDPDLCRRYMARVVKNIKLAPSPEWMQRRLASSGIRPINNLVDITNYVMEEFGQPMHAFDYDDIEGHHIIVRRAKDGESFVTLDGQERKLDKDMLMIADEKRSVGIAGIMGGENSKITDQVKTMVFECACFDGTNIRLSAKRLGLRTDASGKFEKGLDPENCKAAMDRACALIEELGCGEVVGGEVDIYPSPVTPVSIPFRPDWINTLLGTSVSVEDMKQYFDRLELTLDEESGKIRVPSFRQDLKRECDIAEEVARFFGYDNIPTTLPISTTEGKKSKKGMIEDKVRTVARFAGFSQAMSYSFESPKVFDKLQLPKDSSYRNAITIANPLGEDFSVMRTLPLNGMLTSLAVNAHRRNPDVKLFELANTYLPKQILTKENPLSELPDERMQLVLGSYGSGDFFTMKGVCEEILEQLGILDVTVTPSAYPFLHPGRQGELSKNGVKIGYLGEVHPDVMEAYDIKERVQIAVLDMPVVNELADFTIKYTGIAKFPAVTRDIAMVMKKEVLAGEVEAVIRKKGGLLLEHVELFDVYEGAQIQAGFKSMAYSVSFRAKDHTLTDTEVTDMMNAIMEGLTEMGIELRK